MLFTDPPFQLFQRFATHTKSTSRGLRYTSRNSRSTSPFPCSLDVPDSADSPILEAVNSGKKGRQAKRQPAACARHAGRSIEFEGKTAVYRRRFVAFSARPSQKHSFSRLPETAKKKTSGRPRVSRHFPERPTPEVPNSLQRRFGVWLVPASTVCTPEDFVADGHMRRRGKARRRILKMKLRKSRVLSALTFFPGVKTVHSDTKQVPSQRGKCVLVRDCVNYRMTREPAGFLCAAPRTVDHILECQRKEPAFPRPVHSATALSRQNRMPKLVSRTLQSVCGFSTVRHTDHTVVNRSPVCTRHFE
ncbi:hypothetical protein TGPRC2_358110 [Toxoplasma gondii TgCatPRC2]|uniref:Uncharacterized protein n=3 Tax=Toxoplasma gondii TaxID=5811 RepID=A0A151H2M9_TOXGO|nr:hypothetical protein TGMAS_358110 [Toxoplasma gondii MAS]KYK63604.1 hypothetical protein TGPRC2_358110 [Toxoplasma gondii TgCatPRC2]PIM03157.1 hypothetical protein TGCOUG_358110 [Toxoplasma gondii COUG]